MPQNPTRQVHALLGGFVQDALINNQNHDHKTDKIIARTLFFSKNQKLWLAETLVKKDKTYFDQNNRRNEKIFYADRNACWKSVAFTFTKTFAKKRQADFENLIKRNMNKTEATKRSQSKPLQTETPAKNLEADFGDSTKPTWIYASKENAAKQKSRELENLLAEKILTKNFTLKSATAKKGFEFIR